MEERDISITWFRGFEPETFLKMVRFYQLFDEIFGNGK